MVNVEIESNFSVYNSDDTNMRGIGIYILESSGNITGGYIKNNGYKFNTKKLKFMFDCKKDKLVVFYHNIYISLMFYDF